MYICINVQLKDEITAGLSRLKQIHAVPAQSGGVLQPSPWLVERTIALGHVDIPFVQVRLDTIHLRPLLGPGSELGPDETEWVQQDSTLRFQQREGLSQLLNKSQVQELAISVASEHNKTTVLEEMRQSIRFVRTLPQ